MTQGGPGWDEASSVIRAGMRQEAYFYRWWGQDMMYVLLVGRFCRN